MRSRRQAQVIAAGEVFTGAFTAGRRARSLAKTNRGCQEISDDDDARLERCSRCSPRRWPTRSPHRERRRCATGASACTASTEDDDDPGRRRAQRTRCQSSASTAEQPPRRARRLLAEPCVVFATTTCGYCYQTRQLLDELNVEYTAVELDKIPEGRALRAEVAARTGRTSVPAVFIGGEYAGGANDGGLGGALTLHRKGELTPLLADAGALSAEAAAAAAADAAATADAFGCRTPPPLWPRRPAR